MNRTYIIAADGTRFVQEGQGARTLKRGALTIATLMMTLFTAAALTGIVKGAQGDYSAPEITNTASADKVIKLKDAKRACRKAPKEAMNACITLYLRRAWTTPSTFTPAGPALVRECFDQYRGRELRDCLNQPIV